MDRQWWGRYSTAICYKGLTELKQQISASLMRLSAVRKPLRGKMQWPSIFLTGKLTSVLWGTSWLRSIHHSRQVSAFMQLLAAIILFSRPFSELEATMSLSSVGLCLWGSVGALRRTVGEGTRLSYYVYNRATSGSIKPWHRLQAFLWILLRVRIFRSIAWKLKNQCTL